MSLASTSSPTGAGSEALQRRATGRQVICAAHGAFFLAAGGWPLLHMPSFQAVTGPKLERWLVRGVATMMVSIGASLLVAARHRRVGAEQALLANMSGLGLAALDVVYVARKRIKPVYLCDAAAQALLAAGWAIAAR